MTGRLLAYALIAFSTAVVSRGQTIIHSTEEYGPLPAFQGGSGGGIESTDLYSGTTSINIPLLRIGGRGEAGYDMILPVQRRWSVTYLAAIDNNSESYIAELEPVGVPYLPGRLSVVSASAAPGGCYTNTAPIRYFDGGPYLTRIVWTSPSGSPVTLIDDAFGGQAQGPGDCPSDFSYQTANRQRRFRSRDGSNVQFIASQDIKDFNGLNVSSNSPAGTLIFPNGTKYYVDASGAVTQIKDRNGNVVQFNGNTILDPLGRSTTIQTSGSSTVVNYPGANGVRRNITISSDTLQNVLDSGESIETNHCLFPEFSYSNVQNNPTVISSVTFPDGSAYTFKYNSYGEVTTLTLPAGGVYHYRYSKAQACTANTGSGAVNLGHYLGYAVSRRIFEKDEFPDGSSLSSRTLYSTTFGNADNYHGDRPTTLVEVDFQNALQNSLRKEQHYFYGNTSVSSSVPTKPTDYSSWSDSIEYQTITTGTNVWQSQYQMWGQRPCSTTEVCWFGDPQTNQAPAHDPRSCQVNTKLNDGTESVIVRTFDEFCNVTATN